MAAPNIAAATSLYLKSIEGAPTTGGITVLNNAASSNKTLKVTSLVVANIDGSNAADITITIYNQDDLGGTGYKRASTISVAADSTLVVSDASTPIILEEDMSIGAVASADGDLEITGSYEEYDDA